MIIHTIAVRLMRLNWEADLRLRVWSATLTKVLSACIAVVEPIGTCNITNTVITGYCYCSWIRVLIAPSHHMSIVAHHWRRLNLYWMLRKHWISLARILILLGKLN